MVHRVTATDLFSGGGGMSEGMRQAGVGVEIAANHWPVAVATHQKNHPETEHRTKDLSEVDWRTFPSTDWLHGSPSCVWHCRSGGRKRPPAEVERLRSDAGAIDRATAFAIIEAAEVHLYPVVTVENVVEFQDWSLYGWWLDGFKTLGYTVQTMVLDAADFGHGQNRKRLFIAATRGVDLDLTPPDIAPLFASDIIDANPGKPMTRELYISPQIAEIKEDRVPHLVVYRKNAHARRADRNRLATITAGGNHHAVAQLIDGVRYQRLLNNRECARAQGFGDEYEFVGKPDEVKRQIGNAVPVGIGRWFGERITAAFN